jgi:CRP-like cAMP-binding protein
VKNFRSLPLNCPLFEGIDRDDLPNLLDCLSARKKRYEKNSFVFMADEPPRFTGVVLSGSVHIIQDDFWGNRGIVSPAGPGELFAEAFPLAGIPRLPVSVRAAEKSEILLLDCKKIGASCPSACAFHARLVKNLLRILAEKNITLIQKMEHLTRRTTREKLLSFLSARARQARSRGFEIPFNRQELADYLSVDRSAMSASLCAMRDDGVLKFRKNRFELLRKNPVKAGGR